MHGKTFSLFINRLYYQCKGIGILFWIPVIILCGLLPASNYVFWRYSANAADVLVFKQFIDLQWHFFYPVLSIWWPILVLREFVEGNGNEILYVWKKIKLFDAFAMYLVYAVIIGFSFALYHFILPPSYFTLFFYYVKFVVVAWFLCGYMYMAACVSRSIALPLLTIFCYILFALDAAKFNMADFSYVPIMADSLKKLLKRLLPYVRVGILFWVIGYFKNRRMNLTK